jgi:hypothetical protein
MGLDMFLSSRSQAEATPSELSVYWRKANAIHNWFVQNVQNGVDDCGEYPVTRQQLEELSGICKNVLCHHDLAEELLPPTSGFFFGSTRIDDFYFYDLIDTICGVQDLLKADTDTFYYSSSW